MKTVTAAIIFNEDKVLICRRAPEEKLAGYWEFPGGKLEAGESLRQCLERELHEELGLEVRAGEILGRSLYAYEHGEIELVGIRAELLSGEPEKRVHDRLEWVLPERLAGYLLAPADIPLAEIITAAESLSEG